MLRACDDAQSQHPFWYARVLGIYHANVYFGECFRSHPERIEFLFVRWFGHDPDCAGGPAAHRLDRIGWVPEHDASGAFGFLDPACVLRACHLIPAFAEGKTTRLLGPSRMRDSQSGDWVNYYVSRSVLAGLGLHIAKADLRFVDRDMMMRFLGWGIGHRNQPDFPHESNALIASSNDRELDQRENSVATGHSEVAENTMEGGEGGDDLSVDGSDNEDPDVENENLDIEHDGDQVLEFEYQY